MKNITYALVFAFKEILTWHTMKFALLSGFIVSLVWISFAFVFWHQIIAFGSSMLELVPFSMVRSDGAWMLSTFLWLQMVLLTFALIFVFLGNIILRVVPRDKYTSFSILLALVSAAIWTIVWFFNGEYIYQEFLKLMTWLPFETIEKTIALACELHLVYNAIVVTMVFSVGFFSEPLIMSIKKRHALEDEVIRDNLLGSFGYTLKNSAIFILISLLAFPLIFIPVVNIITQIFLWIWLVKDTFSYDAASLISEEVDKKELKEHTAAIWSIGFITSLFNFIPLFNFFGPFFGEIAMFHYLKNVTHKENVNVP